MKKFIEVLRFQNPGIKNELNWAHFRDALSSIKDLAVLRDENFQENFRVVGNFNHWHLIVSSISSSFFSLWCTGYKSLNFLSGFIHTLLNVRVSQR